MPKKDLKNTNISPIDKPRAQTVIVKGTITENQRNLLRKLVGVIGSNEQDVVGKILTLWLYNEGFLRVKNLNSKSNSGRKS